MTLFVIAAGGALGAVSRHLLGGWVQGVSGGGFPWGTLSVNVLGSFLLGLVMVWLQATLASGEARYFVAVGFLGSFTTFSTLSLETLELLQEGLWWKAGLYSVGSLALGLIAVALAAGLAAFVIRPSG